jgi:hypothetical protein
MVTWLGWLLSWPGGPWPQGKRVHSGHWLGIKGRLAPGPQHPDQLDAACYRSRG